MPAESFYSACSDRIKRLLFQREEIVASRRSAALSTWSSGVASNLVGGHFLTGLLLLLHADDALIGLISIVMTIGNLIQILSPLLLERFPSRKRLLIIGRIAIYGMNIVLIGLVPYLPLQNSTLLVLVMIIQLLISLMNAVTAPGFAIWHIKSIPEELRARYYSTLSIINTILIYLIIFLAGMIADHFRNTGASVWGLTVLRLMALVFACLDIFFLFRIKEYPNKQDQHAASPLRLLAGPFKDRKYRLTVLIACMWSFSANLPSSFFSIYLLRDLGVSYSYINIVNLLNIPIMIFLYPVWARRIQSTSWFQALAISMSLYMIYYVVSAFVTAETLFLYPIAMIIAFIFAPGINLVFSNIPYINIPATNQTSYIGFFATMTNLAALISITLGRQFIVLTARHSLTILGMEMQNKQYLHLLTALLVLLGAIAISVLQKNDARAISA